MKDKGLGKIDLKKESFKILLGISYVIGIIFFIRFFNLGRWGIILTLCITNLIWQIIGYIRHRKFSFKGFLIGCIYITIFINFLDYLGKYGVFGYFASIIIICFAILWRRRRKFFQVKHHIETLLFKKPLYEYRAEGKKPPTIGFK